MDQVQTVNPDSSSMLFHIVPIDSKTSFPRGQAFFLPYQDNGSVGVSNISLERTDKKDFRTSKCKLKFCFENFQKNARQKLK